MTNRGLEQSRILVVDDLEANVLLLQELLARWGYELVSGTTDSSQVVTLCESLDPDLVLLDLNMPPPDGLQLLDQLARHIHPPNLLPVLVLTANHDHAMRTRALDLGARDYLEKPFDPTEVRLRVRNLLEMRSAQLALRRHNEQLDEIVHDRTRELQQARLETLERLALAAEFRDDDTHEHAQRVGRTAALLAEKIGWHPLDIERLRRAAPLHDIGKIGIPDAVLLKPGRLTHEEFELIKRHTSVGAQILSGSDSDILRLAEEIALSHHERWDGTGYPAGLSGEHIPLAGRLVALADVFDALTHNRPYKQAWPLARALDEIAALAGKQFDPHLTDLFATLDGGALVTPITGSGSHRLAA
jgi:putative two-component system response regulator